MTPFAKNLEIQKLCVKLPLTGVLSSAQVQTQEENVELFIIRVDQLLKHDHSF